MLLNSREPIDPVIVRVGFLPLRTGRPYTAVLQGLQRAKRRVGDVLDENRRMGRVVLAAAHMSNLLRAVDRIRDGKSRRVRPTADVTRPVVIVRRLPDARAATVVGRALPVLERPAQGVVAENYSRLNAAA